MQSSRSAFFAVVQEADGSEESEIVTLSSEITALPGATIETTDGRRITLLEPAGTDQAAA